MSKEQFDSRVEEAYNHLNTIKTTIHDLQSSTPDKEAIREAFSINFNSIQTQIINKDKVNNKCNNQTNKSIRLINNKLNLLKSSGNSEYFPV